MTNCFGQNIIDGIFVNFFLFSSKISFWEHLQSPCYLPSGIGEKWSFVLIRANLPTNIFTSPPDIIWVNIDICTAQINGV